MTKCTRCGTQNKDDAESCFVCGTDFPRSARQVRDARATFKQITQNKRIPEEKRRRCPDANCGNPASDSDLVCFVCGAKLAPLPLVPLEFKSEDKEQKGGGEEKPRSGDTELQNDLRKYRLASWSHGDWPASRVGAGVCQGMCLDWVRRLLHARMAAYSSSLRRVDENILTHQLWGRASDSHIEALERKRRAVDAERDVLRNRANFLAAEAKGLGQVIGTHLEIVDKVKSGAIVLTAEEKGRLPERTGALVRRMQGNRDAIREIQESHERQQREVKAIAELVSAPIQTHIPYVHAAFQKLWKAEIRRRDGGARQASFDAITTEAGKSRGREAASAKEEKVSMRGEFLWRDVVKPQLQEIKPGDCVILACNKRTATGHAMGLHLTDHGELEYFDPNFSVFRFPSIEELRGVLVRLWDRFYVDDGYDSAYCTIYRLA